jgi:hypothetical protein
MDERDKDLAVRARGLQPEDFALDSAPAQVWDQIQSALEQERLAGPDNDALADSVPLPAKGMAGRRRTPPWWLAAAAAFLAFVAAGVIVIANGSRDQSVVGEFALSNQGLDAAGKESRGSVLVRMDHGQTILDVHVDHLPDIPRTFLELWVIDSDVKGMFSLGPLLGSGVYALPPGVDVKQFPIVDISVQQINGQPTHSGQSILRGVVA